MESTKGTPGRGTPSEATVHGAGENGRFGRWTVLNTVLIVAVLYFARSVLIPVALAMLFTFMLRPLVARLETAVRSRGIAVACVATMAVLFAGGLVFAVGQQFVGLTEELPSYREKLIQKVRGLKAGTNGVVSEAAETIRAVGAELSEGAAPHDAGPVAPAPHTPATAPAKTVGEEGPWLPLSLGPAMLGPLLAPLAAAAIVGILTVMMLMSRESIRDRVIRLAGLPQISMTTRSLEEAGSRIAGYLWGQVLINSIYAVAVGVGLALIGVPNAAVCGLLAGVLRFVPMLGAWLGAVIPAVLAVAVFDGWSELALVAVLFAVLETINNVVLEPRIYGSSTGVSPLGVVLSLVFWTWLWGPIGLVMAMPVTVCLIVFARQVPQLRVLEVILGEEPALSAPARFYQRLLVGDEDEAAAVLRETEEAATPSEVIDRLVIPALSVARRDLRAESIDVPRADRIGRGVRELTLDWLGEVAPAQAAQGEARVSVLPALDGCDQAAGEILGSLLAAEGVPATVWGNASLLSEVLDAAERGNTPVIVISSVEPASATHTRRLVKAIRRRMPAAQIVIASWNGSSGEAAIPSVESSHRVTTMSGAVKLLKQMSDAPGSAASAEGDSRRTGDHASRGSPAAAQGGSDQRPDPLPA